MTTFSALSARRSLASIVAAINELLDTAIDEARDLEAHDHAAAVALREYVARMRGDASFINHVGAHLCETKGSVTG